MEKRIIDFHSLIINSNDTFMAVCSSESSATDTTKTSTGKSSLTGAIVQTWVAATKILLRGKKFARELNEITCSFFNSVCTICTKI